jgi:hypothetical protein
MQGMTALTLSTGKWLVCGRQAYGDPYAAAFFLLSGTTLDSTLFVIEKRKDAAGSDYGYAEVILYNGWYYFTWYNATVANQTSGVYFTKIKAADVEELALT